jgi:pimeloyl-ACP methyl ester carboxylesterase/DNA-binding CsgD family transcriptional regulator
MSTGGVRLGPHPVRVLPRLSSMSTMDQVVRHTALDGRSVAWSAVGSGPILVMGGWWSSHLQLDWQDPLFRRFVEQLGQSFTVVRYDRPGTGLSDRVAPPPEGLEEEVAVLAAVIEATGGLPVNLFGGSTGCPIAATYAARNADRVTRLVLYGGYARGSDIASPAAQETMVDLVERHWGLGSRVLADVFLPDATGRERAAFATFQRRSAPREVAASSLRAVYAIDASADLPQVSRPTLVLHRRNDRAIPFALGRDLANGIPGATFIELAGENHFPWRGDSSSIAWAVERFLSGREVTAMPAHRQPSEATLSERELEVLRLVARGLTDAEVAERLVLSVHTVHRHIANIRTRLGVATRSAAAAWAGEHGML